MLSGIAIVVMVLGATLLLYGLMGSRFKGLGTLLPRWLGEFAQGIAFVLGLTLLAGGGWLYPSQVTDRSLASKKHIEKQVVASQVAAVPTQAGAIFRDCTECPEMVVLPKGEMMMGAASNDPDHTAHETPQHQVTIQYALAVAKFEVTFVEWDKCAASKDACRQNVQTEWGRNQHPVVNVGWDDAQTYLTWLNKSLGLEGVHRYRLLTEAEWEYAARAGSQARYAWGGELGDHHANCNDCSLSSKVHEPATVGAFSANSFALFDMHGNVSEWVEDCWHSDYQGAPNDGSAWVNMCSEARRVVRGGGWNSPAHVLRSSARDRKTWDEYSPNIGFRIARVVS